MLLCELTGVFILLGKPEIYKSNMSFIKIPVSHHKSVNLSTIPPFFSPPQLSICLINCLLSVSWDNFSLTASNCFTLSDTDLSVLFYVSYFLFFLNFLQVSRKVSCLVSLFSPATLLLFILTLCLFLAAELSFFFSFFPQLFWIPFFHPLVLPLAFFFLQ